MIHHHDNPFAHQPTADLVTDPLNPILQSDAELLGTPAEPLTTPTPAAAPDRRFSAPGNDIVPTQVVRPNELGSKFAADRLEQRGHDHVAASIGHITAQQTVRQQSAAERIAAIDAHIDNHKPELPIIGRSNAVDTIGRLNPDNLLGR